MQEYPHLYIATASGSEDGVIDTASPGLESIPVMPPAEFDGPGDMWSPETMLVAAVANCFILTFRAVARASHFDWDSLDCKVIGVLNRVERVTRFTEYQIAVTLRLPKGADWHKAHRIAEKSVNVCLVTNSLNGDKTLELDIEYDD